MKRTQWLWAFGAWVSVCVATATASPESWPAGAPDASGPFLLDASPQVQLISDRTWIVDDSRALWRTDDGGRTWTLIADQRPLPRRGLGVDCFHFLDGRLGLLIQRGTAYRTLDGGKSWESLGDLLGASQDKGPSAWVTSCTLTDATHAWAVGTKHVGSESDRYVPFLLVSEDGGVSWKARSLPPGVDPLSRTLRKVFFLDVRNGWAVGQRLVLRTRDGGHTWTVVDAANDYRDVYFATPDFGWVVDRSPTDFMTTTDGGDHWIRRRGPPPYGDWPANPVCFTGEHCLAGPQHLYSTHDGGGHWIEQRLPNAGSQVSISYVGLSPSHRVILLAGVGGSEAPLALISADEGKTWRLAGGTEARAFSAASPFQGVKIPTARLNRCATQRDWPEYPALAKVAGVAGSVEVEVQVNRTGKVEASRVVSGDPLLLKAALLSARRWTFDADRCGGDGHPFFGTLVFNFPPG